MNDEQTKNQQTQNTTSPFADELTKLGKHFSQLVKDALESPQLGEMRKEVTSGVQGVIDEINEAMNKARSSQVTQDVAQKATRAAQEVKSGSVSGSLKAGVLNVMKSVNQELSKLVERMEKEEDAGAAEDTETDATE